MEQHGRGAIAKSQPGLTPRIPVKMENLDSICLSPLSRTCWGSSLPPSGLWGFLGNFFHGRDATELRGQMTTCGCSCWLEGTGTCDSVLFLPLEQSRGLGRHPITKRTGPAECCGEEDMMQQLQSTWQSSRLFPCIASVQMGSRSALGLLECCLHSAAVTQSPAAQKNRSCHGGICVPVTHSKITFFFFLKNLYFWALINNPSSKSPPGTGWISSQPPI